MATFFGRKQPLCYYYQTDRTKISKKFGLVHHATILGLTGPSYRTDKAKEKANEAKPTLTETNPTLEESTNAQSS